jgi:hypothetical protein
MCYKHCNKFWVDVHVRAREVENLCDNHLLHCRQKIHLKIRSLKAMSLCLTGGFPVVPSFFKSSLVFQDTSQQEILEDIKN